MFYHNTFLSFYRNVIASVNVYTNLQYLYFLGKYKKLAERKMLVKFIIVQTSFFKMSKKVQVIVVHHDLVRALCYNIFFFVLKRLTTSKDIIWFFISIYYWVICSLSCLCKNILTLWQ